MRTLTTPAIAPKSPTATLWDTPVPVVAPTPPVALKTERKPDEPPFDLPGGKVDDGETHSKEAIKYVKKHETKAVAAVEKETAKIADALGLSDTILKEHKLLDPIYAAHADIIALEEKIYDLSNKLKECEFDLSSATDAKATLLAALPDQLFAIRTGKRPAPKLKPAAPTSSTPVVDNSWRLIATSTITTGVVGLGEKKAEKLIDEMPTLGDLSDAMARAVAMHRHFADELPKGIGKLSADELANRVMAAQTAGDGRPASEVVEPRKKKNETVTEDKLPTDKQHERFVRTMIASLKVDATGESLSGDQGETWNDGWEAAIDGEPAETCPKELQQEYQVDWLRGWLCYSMFGDQEPEGEPVAEVAETDDADYGAKDIEHRGFVERTIKWLAENPSELPVDKASNREMWQVGNDGFHEGADCTDCPTEVAHTSEELAITEAMQVDWLRGWVSADLQESGDVELTADESKAVEPSAIIEPDLTTGEPSIIGGGDIPIELLDDIADIAERVKAEDDKTARVSQEAWEAGYTAAVDQQPIEVFPDLPGPEIVDWVRGWVFGSQIDFDL